jgi:hypothetical protein
MPEKKTDIGVNFKNGSNSYVFFTENTHWF